MLVIRFARRGRNKRAFFDLVAAEKTKAVQKKIVAKLGYYDPHTENGKGNFVFDAELLKKYIGNGAQVSDSVAKRLVRAGFTEAAKFVAVRVSKPQKPKEEAPAEEAAE